MHTELVRYSTATELALAYAECTTKLRGLLAEVNETCERLHGAFEKEDIRGFRPFTVGLNFEQETYACDQEGVEAMLLEFRRAAWRVLIGKLEIMKIMSSKRQEELKSVLHARWGNRWGVSQETQMLPEIDSETIMSVLEGFVASAEGYLHEKVVEEFEFWRPGLIHRSRYKTNSQPDRVSKKVIRGWMVQSGYGTKWRINYHNESHVIALDSVFHMLDGKGPLREHKGALVAAIETTQDGTGETDYFKFKCFKNGNLHLAFKRLDLLAEFNRIGAAGSNRVGEQVA